MHSLVSLYFINGMFEVGKGGGGGVGMKGKIRGGKGVTIPPVSSLFVAGCLAFGI